MDYTWCALPHKDPRMLIWLTWSDLSLDARLFHGQLLTKKNQWCLQDALANLRKQLKLVHFPSMSHLKPGFKPSSSGMEPENSLNPSTCSTWRIYITPKKSKSHCFSSFSVLILLSLRGIIHFQKHPICHAGICRIPTSTAPSWARRSWTFDRHHQTAEQINKFDDDLP